MTAHLNTAEPEALVRERLDLDDAAIDGSVIEAELPPMRPRQRRQSIKTELAQAVAEATMPDVLTERQQLITGGAPVNIAADDPPVIDAAADDPVALGREEWLRLKEDAPVTWDKWRKIGAAVYIGRQETMAAVGAKKPKGKKYNVRFGHWLQLNGFDDIDSGDRGKLLRIMENLSAVEAWRATLSEADRLRWNHPYSVWTAWKRGGRYRQGQGTAAPAPAVVPAVVATAKTFEQVADDFDEEQEELVWQRGLYFRAKKAAADAELKSHWALPEPPDERTELEVERAAKNWAATLQYVQWLRNTTAEERAEARRSYAENQEAKRERAEARAEKAQARTSEDRNEIPDFLQPQPAAQLERERL